MWGPTLLSEEEKERGSGTWEGEDGEDQIQFNNSTAEKHFTQLCKWQKLEYHRVAKEEKNYLKKCQEHIIAQKMAGVLSNSPPLPARQG